MPRFKECGAGRRDRVQEEPMSPQQQAPSESEIDIKRTVADLDTQYQLAVKNHDVATMDRILADDFVLVTGRGTTFTKSDLLEEARGNVVYEHQEDTHQTVRVWGDTAVVTALLWA